MEQFFLTLVQNNFENKMPLLFMYKVTDGYVIRNSKSSQQSLRRRRIFYCPQGRVCMGNTVVYLVVLCMFFQSNMANWWEITDVTIRPIGISVQFSHRPPSQILRQLRDPGPPGQSCPPRKSSFMGTIRLKQRIVSKYFSSLLYSKVS